MVSRSRPYIEEQDARAEVKRLRRDERAAEKAKARERDRWKNRAAAAAGD